MDDPESGQPFGSRSKRSLTDLASRREVAAGCPKIDRFGQRVCKVIANDLDVGLEQVSRGMGWRFRHYGHEQGADGRSAHSTAEIEARRGKRGHWREAATVPPWE